jgi:hypothetical protein
LTNGHYPEQDEILDETVKNLARIRAKAMGIFTWPESNAHRRGEEFRKEPFK